MTTKEAIAILRSVIGIMDAPMSMKALSTITRQLRNERKVFRAISEYCDNRSYTALEYCRISPYKKCNRRNCPAIKGENK